MAATQLKTLSGGPVSVQEGESCDLVVSFSDMAGEVIDKASLLSLVVTLYDELTNQVINDRNQQNVIDDNDGSVADDGTLTLKLGPEDSIVVGSEVAVGEYERHAVVFVFTWDDGDDVRTGKTPSLGFKVVKLPTPA